MATARELYFRNVLNENFHGRAFLIIREREALASPNELFWRWYASKLEQIHTILLFKVLATDEDVMKFH